jgi:excisionase family DNA binding protein
MESDLLSVDDIKRILKVSKATAQRWCHDGKLPAAKIGRVYRIRKEDFDKWFEEKLQETARKQ